MSRLTLWIDGEEREAAFAARRKTREAYQQVVRRQRDPVLVTTSGPDRVLMQCFPVPPGGEMKVRLGITSPMLLNGREKATLPLPCFLERNFSIPENVRHSVWVESRSPLGASSRDLVEAHPEDGLYAIRGMMSDSEISSGQAAVHASKPPDALIAWTPDPVRGDTHVVRQVIEEARVTRPSVVVFVIDGSGGMADSVPAIAESLAGLPEGTEFGVLVASDTVVELVIPAEEESGEACRQTGERLRALEYPGGQDNVAARARAWDVAAQQAGHTRRSCGISRVAGSVGR